MIEWEQLRSSGWPLFGMQINRIKSCFECTPYSITPSLFLKAEYAEVLGILENVGVPVLSTWNNVVQPLQARKAQRGVLPKPQGSESSKSSKSSKSSTSNPNPNPKPNPDPNLIWMIFDDSGLCMLLASCACVQKR